MPYLRRLGGSARIAGGCFLIEGTRLWADVIVALSEVEHTSRAASASCPMDTAAAVAGAKRMPRCVAESSREDRRAAAAVVGVHICHDGCGSCPEGRRVAVAAPRVRGVSAAASRDTICHPR